MVSNAYWPCLAIYKKSRQDIRMKSFFLHIICIAYSLHTDFDSQLKEKDVVFVSLICG